MIQCRKTLAHFSQVYHINYPHLYGYFLPVCYPDTHPRSHCQHCCSPDPLTGCCLFRHPCQDPIRPSLQVRGTGVRKAERTIELHHAEDFSLSSPRKFIGRGIQQKCQLLSAFCDGQLSHLSLATSLSPNYRVFLPKAK